MKYYLLIFLLIFSNINAQWIESSLPVEINSVHDIQIVNEKLIYSSARSQNQYGNNWQNYFIKSLDSGLNWSTVKLPSYLTNISSIDFIDSLNGYAVAQLRDNTDQTVIIKTGNAGETWRLCFTTPDSITIIPRDIKYVNNNICVAIGFAYDINHSFLILSENGGWSWEIINYPCPHLYNLTFINDTTLYISGAYESKQFGRIFISEDYGKSYVEIPSPELNGLNLEYIIKFLIKDDNKLFLGGFGYDMDYSRAHLFQSENAGLTWEEINLPTSINALYDMEKDINSNSYFFSCDVNFSSQGNIYKTENNIINWETMHLSNHSDTISDICISDRLKVARSRNNIFIFDSTVTTLKNELSTYEKSHFLSQNYPNPFNPTTIIKYTIPYNEKGTTSNVKITVYDNLGKEVYVIVDEEQSPGSYEVEFNAINLPSGVYYYQLKNRHFIETKKLILVR